MVKVFRFERIFKRWKRHSLKMISKQILWNNFHERFLITLRVIVLTDWLYEHTRPQFSSQTTSHSTFLNRQILNDTRWRLHKLEDLLSKWFVGELTNHTIHGAYSRSFTRNGNTLVTNLECNPRQEDWPAHGVDLTAPLARVYDRQWVVRDGFRAWIGLGWTTKNSLRAKPS